MPGLFRKHAKILQLRASIALSEGMDVVDVANNHSGFIGENIGAETTQKLSSQQTAVHVRHAGFDEAKRHELCAAFGDLYNADLSRPVVDVLENVAMDGAELAEIKIACRKALSYALRRQAAFVAVKNNSTR